MKASEKIILFLCIALSIHLSYSETDSSQNTLDVSIPKPKSFDYLVELFRIKAQWNGVNFSAFRSFTKNIHAYVSVKKKNELFIPDVEEGFLTWRKSGFTISGGKLAKRYGRCQLYSSTFIYNPLFENWILWEEYGVGLSLEKKIKKTAITGAFTLDTRSSAAFHLLYKVSHNRYHGSVLGGIRSSFDENLDDVIIVGTEHSLNYRIVKLHSVFKYEYHTCYRRTENITFKPYDAFAGFLESQFGIAPFLDLTLLTYFRKSLQKQPLNESLSHGYIAELLVKKRFGIGQGFEIMNVNGVLTTSPETFFIVRLLKGLVSIKVNLVTKYPHEAMLSGRGVGKL
jgi:hypothetical protein